MVAVLRRSAGDGDVRRPLLFKSDIEVESERECTLTGRQTFSWLLESHRIAFASDCSICAVGIDFDRIEFRGEVDGDLLCIANHPFVQCTPSSCDEKKQMVGRPICETG